MRPRTINLVVDRVGAFEPRIASALIGGLRPRHDPGDYAAFELRGDAVLASDVVKTTRFDRLDDVATTHFERPEPDTLRHVRRSAPYERVEVADAITLVRVPVERSSRHLVAWTIVISLAAFALGVAIPFLVT